ncbi:hypothetical protein QBC43DRAFT_91521 [Cladorrhinum sp. PSN259]|nr:hypothetical protein QBC43DRAFT_91521 [Cladorrhinum sp. PSN259]
MSPFLSTELRALGLIWTCLEDYLAAYSPLPNFFLFFFGSFFFSLSSSLCILDTRLFVASLFLVIISSQAFMGLRLALFLPFNITCNNIYL